MSDEMLTVQEVAALLKVADKTVYTMAQRGSCHRSRSVGSGGFAAPTSTPGSTPRSQPRGARGTAMRSHGAPSLEPRALHLLLCAEAAPRFGVI